LTSAPGRSSIAHANAELAAALEAGILPRARRGFAWPYMRVVFATSRVVRIGMDEMVATARAGSNVALAVLHQDVVLSGMVFRDLGIVTVANVGDAGDIIAAVLVRCGGLYWTLARWASLSTFFKRSAYWASVSFQPLPPAASMASSMAFCASFSSILARRLLPGCGLPRAVGWLR
jgi:hypothetical protein